MRIRGETGDQGLLLIIRRTIQKLKSFFYVFILECGSQRHRLKKVKSTTNTLSGDDDLRNHQTRKTRRT